MAFLKPENVYILALQAIPKVTTKFPIADKLEFARILTGLSFQESCVKKTTKDYECFDTEARPRDKKGNLASSAVGLTQILKDTQGWIEGLMKWKKRPSSAREEPQYAMDLCAAYMAYFYNGGRKTPRGDWYAALVAYHDGHYSKKGAGHAYAKLIFQHIKLFDFAGMRARYGNYIAQLEHANRAEYR